VSAPPSHGGNNNNGTSQLRGKRPSSDLAGSSCFQAAGCLDSLIVGKSQKQDPDVRVDRQNADHRIEAAHIRHRQIHQYNVWPEVLCLIDRLASRAGFSYDFNRVTIV
jgi:hypothetical protein